MIYKINKEKGLVKCTVKAYNTYYTGKAKVNTDEGDVFDEEKGKKIARCRALLKMKKALLNSAIDELEFIMSLESVKEELSDYIQKITESMNRLEEILCKELDLEIKEEPVELI